MSSTGRSEALHFPDGLPLPVEIRGVRGARRLRLRLDPARLVLKLTGPARMNRKAALDWAESQSAWVCDQMAALHPAEPFVPGAVIPVEGKDRLLCWTETRSRQIRLEPEALVGGGPLDGYARRIELFLKRRALLLLSQDSAEFAELCGRKPISIAVGDAGTRWGSCSSAGRIRYSWRLILAPPEVRRYVAAHEIAHLRHFDHGAEFKSLEKSLLGTDPEPARLLLRQLGPRLKRIGRDR